MASIFWVKCRLGLYIYNKAFKVSQLTLTFELLTVFVCKYARLTDEEKHSIGHANMHFAGYSTSM